MFSKKSPFGLEQQVWAANGEPDKSQGNDPANDGGGYFIHRVDAAITHQRQHDCWHDAGGLQS
ncbi:hypothetical protein PsP108CL_06240 [Pseudomonas syringae]|nr:hypothetical protein [Pseudomonas syringae]